MDTDRKIFTKIGAFIFLLIGTLQLLRVIYGWEAFIGGVEIPLWPSILAVVVAFVMSWGLWRESS